MIPLRLCASAVNLKSKRAYNVRMGITLFGVGLILLFLILGYYRGVLRILAVVFSLVIGALFAGHLSFLFRGWLATSGYVPKALVPLASLVAAGLVVFLALTIVFELILSARQKRRKEEGLPPLQGWERFGGALLGGIWGLALVMIIFSGIDIIGRVEEAMAVPPAESNSKDPKKAQPPESTFSSLRKDLNGSVFGPLVQEVNPIDEKVSKTFHDLTVVIADPVLFEKFQNHPTVAILAQDPRMIEIAQDPEIQGHIQNKEFYDLLDNDKIAALLQDKELFHKLKDVDMGAILEEVIQEGQKE